MDGADSLAKLSDKAIANPAEVKAYWGATLPNTPMPQAILDMLALQEGICICHGPFLFKEDHGIQKHKASAC